MKQRVTGTGLIPRPSFTQFVHELRKRIGESFDVLKNAGLTTRNDTCTGEVVVSDRGDESCVKEESSVSVSVSVLERVFLEARGVHASVRGERAAWRVHPRESVVTCRVDTPVLDVEPSTVVRLSGEHAGDAAGRVVDDDTGDGDGDGGDADGVLGDAPGFVRRVEGVIGDVVGEVSGVWARLVAYESWFAYCRASQRCAGVRGGEELSCEECERGVSDYGDGEPVRVDEYVLCERVKGLQ